MNIILIGMPGAGKSTIGVLLAKSKLMNFVDTDLIIQNKYGKSLCELINEHGTDSFIEIENDVIVSQNFSNSVIATGGSAVFGNEAMKKLKENGTVVYLKLPVEVIKSRISNIKTRGVVMHDGETLDDLYKERCGLYEKYADITLDCAELTAEQCVEKLVEILE